MCEKNKQENRKKDEKKTDGNTELNRAHQTHLFECEMKRGEREREIQKKKKNNARRK